jgi:hypothetical protein
VAAGSSTCTLVSGESDSMNVERRVIPLREDELDLVKEIKSGLIDENFKLGKKIAVIRDARGDMEIKFMKSKRGFLRMEIHGWKGKRFVFDITELNPRKARWLAEWLMGYED